MHRLHGKFIGYVGDDVDRFAARFVDLSGRRLCRVGVDVVDDHFCAQLPKAQSNRFANAATRTGD